MLKRSLFSVAALLAMGGLVGMTAAQQPDTQQPPTRPTQERPAQTQAARPLQPAQAQQANQAEKGFAYRASDLQGMKVKNAEGKELGSVSDIVVDTAAGQVRYAALSYGGALGLGDKLFAVPWAAFRYQHNAGDENQENCLVLNVEEKALKSAPGFDQDNWPNFATADFRQKIDSHYQGKFQSRSDRIPINRQAEDDTDAGLEVQAGNTRVDVDVRTEQDQASPTARQTQPETPENGVVVQSEKIIGVAVYNTEGKQLGTINDLVVDMDTGKVRYAAVSYGGFLGLGDKLFAVPWNAFRGKYYQSEQEYRLMLPIDEVTLRKAPGFDQDKWPDLGNATFAAEIDKHYGPAIERARNSSDRIERNQTDRSEKDTIDR